MKCPNCQTEVDQNTKICPNCGKELVRKKSKKTVLIVLCVLAVLGGLYFILHQKPQDNSAIQQSEEKTEPYSSVDQFNEEVMSIYADEKMSNQEKVEAAQKCADRLIQSDLSIEDKRKSVDVPSDVRAVLSQEYSDWTVKSDQNVWTPVYFKYPNAIGVDFDKELIPLGREDNQMKLPETGYRYGGEGGYNYTCAASDGHIPTMDERCLPKYYIPEKDKEVHFDNAYYFDLIDAIRSYDTDKDLALQAINTIIDEINTGRGTDIKPMEEDELDAIHDAYVQLQDSWKPVLQEELNIEDPDYFAYGFYGYTAALVDDKGDVVYAGGSQQFDTALPEYALIRVGVEYYGG